MPIQTRRTFALAWGESIRKHEQRISLIHIRSSHLPRGDHVEFRTPADVMGIVRGYAVSAALGAALELGLFWQLEKRAASAEEVAKSLDIPAERTRRWLEFLVRLGFLKRDGGSYEPSLAARKAIMETLKQDSWAYLAEEAREGYLACNDLPLHIHRLESVWAAQGLEPPDFYARLAEDGNQADRFTRMLYDYHQSLGEELAEALDMTGVKRLMDLGGGSGVMSLALLDRHGGFTATVVDAATVCQVGERIVSESDVADRISFHPMDFLKDALPGGFDMVLECDVGIHSEELYLKIRKSLNDGGRFVIVDDLVQKGRSPPLHRLRHAFLASLNDPNYKMRTVADLEVLLGKSGYSVLSKRTMHEDMVMIEARK